MSESEPPVVPAGSPPTPADPATSVTPPGQPPPKRRRRWLKRIVIGVVVILVLLIGLVLLAPTILSTSPARNFAARKISENLNGRVAIDAWSISWNGGLWLQGVKVFDDRDRLVLELGKLSTQLSLLDAMKGNIALGKTVI